MAIPSISQTYGPNIPTVLPGLLFETAVDTITATGSTQQGAYAIYADGNRFTTVPLGSGCVLPAAFPGLDICIVNHGANPLQIYAAGSDTIDDVAGNVGVSQMANSFVFYECFGPGAWYTNGIGTGYAKSFPTVSFTDQIAAVNPGAQSTATPLVTVINRVVTVPAGASGVALPVAMPGLQIQVSNAHASNAIQIYGANGSSDTIDGVAGSTGFALLAGKSVTLYSAAATVWHKILSA